VELIMAQTTDSAIKSTSRAYVVFDKGTGEIIHVHYAVTFSSDAPVSEKPEASALRLAGAAAGAHVDVLATEPARVNNLKPMKVDVANRTIVEKITRS
jgi:hypothetical protein